MNTRFVHKRLKKNIVIIIRTLFKDNQYEKAIICVGVWNYMRHWQLYKATLTQISGLWVLEKQYLIFILITNTTWHLY